MSNSRKKIHNIIIISILLIAFLLRIATLFGMRLKNGTIQLESWEQETIALNILDGKGFVYPDLGTDYHSYCEPLYVYFIVLIYFLFSINHLILGVLQALISALTCLLLYACGKRIFNKSAGIAAMLLAAIHPGLIVYTTKIHPLNIDVFFITALLLVFLRLFYIKEVMGKDIFLTGSIAGLTLLTRPTALPFMVFALALLILKRRVSVKKFLFLLISIGLIGSIWTVRNYVTHKEFIFTRSGTGKVFWIGNNPNASGSALQPNGVDVFDSAPDNFKMKILGKNEIQQNRLFKEAFFDFIKQHPIKFLHLFFKKIYFFFWFSPQSGILYSKTALLTYKLFYTPIVIFALYGLSLVYKNKNFFEIKFILPLFFVISIAIVQGIFYVEGRHRWAIEPIILIFTAYGFLNFAKKYLLRRTNALDLAD